MATTKRDSFVFYRSFQQSIERFSQDEQLFMYRSITDYAFNQIEPSFDGLEHDIYLNAIWIGIKAQLDANYKRFVNGCKGGEFGCKGGAPKGNKNAKKQPQNNPKTTPNVNDNVNDNLNVKENSNKHALIFPFTDEGFMSTWNELLKQPKWRKKTDSQLQKTLNRMKRYDVYFVVEEMNATIENGWQGVLYKDADVRYEQWKKARANQDFPTTIIRHINNN